MYRSVLFKFLPMSASTCYVRFICLPNEVTVLFHVDDEIRILIWHVYLLLANFLCFFSERLTLDNVLDAQKVDNKEENEQKVQ